MNKELLILFMTFINENYISKNQIDESIVIKDFQEFVDELNINDKCKKEFDFSNDLKKGDTCLNCEFCMTTESQDKYCEKGYWKDGF